MTGQVTAAVGGAVLGGVIAKRGAESAAQTGADASTYAANLSYDQYLQNRQDQSPYREVAVGEEVYGHRDSYQALLDAHQQTRTAVYNSYLDRGLTPQQANAEMANWDRANPSLNEQQFADRYGVEDMDAITGYTGGALNTLAEYGRSRVDPADYLPDTEIPTYRGSQIGALPGVFGRVPDYTGGTGNIPRFGVQGDIPEFQYGDDVPQFDVQTQLPEFNITGDIPEFDSTQFDIYKDPSYDWRVGEMERSVNRNMASAGKITSGNRLEELMERAGEMASQEYGSAYDRMLTDYGIQRENEATRYGRDVTDYDYDRMNELARRGFDVQAYDYGRSRESDLYGRATQQYGLSRGVETDRYGRDVTSYDYGRARESDLFGRGLSVYDIDRTNALTRYGFDVDTYNRLYGQDVDQYGRDLTAYNARVSQEQGMYDRGLGQYGIAYGEEGDYLNRLAALSNIGQTATQQTGNIGSQLSGDRTRAIMNAANTQAAGQLASSQAMGNMLSDIGYSAGRFLNQPQTYRPPAPTTTGTNYSPVPTNTDPSQFYWS